MGDRLDPCLCALGVEVGQALGTWVFDSIHQHKLQDRAGQGSAAQRSSYSYSDHSDISISQRN